MSKSPLLVLHLVGLALSVGSVLALDLRLVRLLCGGRIAPEDLGFAAFLKPLVRAGLVLLWISGLGFLVLGHLNGSDLLANPKLHAKVAIVAVLTLNGVAVERHAFGALARNVGRRLFDGLSQGQAARLLLVAAVSAAGWYAALVMGAVRELNFLAGAEVFLLAYGGLVAGAAGLLWGIKRLVYDAGDAAAEAGPLQAVPSPQAQPS